MQDILMTLFVVAACGLCARLMLRHPEQTLLRRLRDPRPAAFLTCTGVGAFVLTVFFYAQTLEMH